MPDQDTDADERLKSALWYSIGQIIDHESLRSNCNATPQYIGALTEMVWAQLESVGRDLESFAKHAGRTQISVDDVTLLARRNEGLEALLRAYLEKQRKENGGGAARGARR